MKTSAVHGQVFLLAPGAKHPLKKCATDVKSLYHNDADYVEQLDELRERLSERQDVLFADARFGVLIIFQGMDTAGKDSAIKHIMSGLNPMGVSVTSFRAPSEEERKYDFLRRAHVALPSKGKIGIFNRSYYEEVVTVRVHPEYLEPQKLPPDAKDSPKKSLKHLIENRFDDINSFEDYLKRQGILVLKFFLHLSKKEQRARLLARIDEKDKNWKFDAGDITEREHWKDYQTAYDDCLANTSTKTNPWYVIPADDKKNARLVISKILVERLNELPITYPTVPAAQQRELKKIRKAL